MCGRFGLTRPPWSAVERIGGSEPNRALYQPRYNVAPTQQVFAITNKADRPVTGLRWGLVPQWAESPAAVKLSTFNARVETIATARTYQGPTRSRRCVVLATGFYEWRKNDNDGGKTPFWIHRIDGEPFAFAGLWDIWPGRLPGEEDIASCTIVTGPANDFIAPIHSRMPIVLSEENARAWTTPSDLAADEAIDLLIPTEHEPTWEMYAVSTRVGNVRNDDPELTTRSQKALDDPYGKKKAI